MTNASFTLLLLAIQTSNALLYLSDYSSDSCFWESQVASGNTQSCLGYSQVNTPQS